ncbi:MAG TPA: helix-turn-helix domain-containing protein [Blastocatellia bacterium]|nr:helix-turn-helix domain-containing protein [Blastocatellia bacterium]
MKVNDRHRTEAERLNERKLVSELQLQGWSIARIAKEIGRSPATVWKDLQWAHQQWLRETVRDVDIIKVRELKRLDQVESEAWEGWRLSLKDKTENKTDLREDDKKQVNVQVLSRRSSVRRVTQTGDPEFLKTILGCVAERCKILGTYAPLELDANALRATIDEELRRLQSEQPDQDPDEELASKKVQ